MDDLESVAPGTGPTPAAPHRNPEAERNRMVEENLNLVRRVAHRLCPHARPDRFEELVSAGTLGLMKAAEAFDPSRGFRFSTLAWRCVRQAMSLSAMEPGVVRVSRQIDPERRREALARVRAVPLPAGADGEETAVPDPLAGPDALAEEADEAARVRAALGRLRKSDRELLRMRHFEGWTLLEVGRAMGVSKERARQLQKKAEARLRAELERAGNDDKPSHHCRPV